MLTIGVLSLNSLDYYLDLAAEDYYLNGGEPPGRWFFGNRARTLGLTGLVQKEDFRKLFMGFHPRTGEALVQNAGRTKGKRRRRPGFDLTFGIPKAASCLITTSIWESVRCIHDDSVRGSMELLQNTRAYIRVGSGSKKDWSFRRASIIAALFEHTVSRELDDPHLHSHALLASVGVTDYGETGALHSPFFFKKHQRHFIGAYYRSLVAYRLRTEARLEIYRKGVGFGIKGMPDSLVDERSKRTKQIEAYKKKHGITGGADAKKATLATRRTKQDIPPREELYKKWAKENKEHGLTERAVRKMQRAEPRDPEKDLPELLATSVKNMYRKGLSHFSEIELQIEALQESVNWGVHPKVLLKALAKHLKESDEIIALPSDGEDQRYTTKTIREQERRLFGNSRRLRDTAGLIVDLKTVKRVLARYRLTEEQRRAVEHLVRSPGSLRLLDGRAGTGKTSIVLKACKEIWEECGYRVIGAAYTGKAAVELEQATGIPTETIHWQLADFKCSFGFEMKHHLKQFARAAQGKRTYRFKKPKPVKIDGKTILVVDEMSMANVRHVQMLTELVSLGGGLLAGVGDGLQIAPVKGQSPFRSLCNRYGCAELKDIIRQKEEWAQKVAKLMSEGEAGKAISILAAQGLVKPCEDMDAALEQLVRDWNVEGVKHPDQAPILVSTNREAEAANDLCQQARLEAGEIGGGSVQITDDDEDGSGVYSSRVYRGDRILFTRNSRSLKVRNGFTGTVIGNDPFGRRLTVLLDDGERITVPPKKYRHLRRGYALTVHKAQGGTYANCWVLAGPNQTMPSAYVEMSRAVLKTHVYTSKELLDERLEDIEDSPLAKQMSEKPDLRLATDLLEGVQLDEPTEAKADEPKPLALPTGAKGWWESKESGQEPEQPVPWWARAGEPDPKAFTDETVRRERERWRRQEAAKRSALAKAKREYKSQELEEQQLLETGRLDELKSKKEQLAEREAVRKEVAQRGERKREQLRQEAAHRKEREDAARKNARRRATLARARRERTKREQAEQQQYASGQWEREKLKREQAAARAALEKLIHERAEQEREERHRYAAAQAEAERRRKALLAQLFLVTSSVTEPRRTQAGNRDLLNASITAMFSLKDAEAITQTQTASPIAGYLLAELFTPPKKEEPLTLDVEVVSAEERASSGHATPAQTIGVDAEQPECADDRVSQSNSQETVYARSSSYGSSQSTSSSFDSSSSPPPDYTTSTASTYQPASAYTETQIQSMQMATFQYTGAAQTQASQQANPTKTYNITNQNM